MCCLHPVYSVASLVALTVKNLPATWETWVLSLGQEDTLKEGMNPLQYSCLENPMDRRAWRATVHRVAQSRTLLKRLTTHNLLHNIILTAVTAENPASQRQDGNASRLFSAFVAISGYCALTLIQKVWRSEVISNILYGHHYFRSQPVDPLLARTKSINLAYSQMGHRSIPSQFEGVLWFWSHAQTLLKAKIGDHAPAGRKMALA